jgi:DNA-binding PadR family transcriptional regulator
MPIVTEMPTAPQSLRRPPLPPAVFLILLSLQDEDAHGYRIRGEVLERSNGAVRLDPGSLYRLIARLLDEGLIVESPGRTESGEERRRTYRLTPAGRRVLVAETERMADLVAQARSRGIKRPRPV